MGILSLSLDQDIPSGESLRSLVELCAQFGPVAFAVLFLFFVIRWSHDRYVEGVKAKLPSPEIKTLRGVFIGTAITAVCLVGASVWYSVKYRPELYVYRGELVNLHDYERVSSTVLYRLERLHGPVADSAPVQRDEEFVVMRTSPFRPGETFTIDFSKGDGRVVQLDLPFVADQGPRFFVDWDEPTKRTVLRRATASAPKPQARSLLPVLLAAAARSRTETVTTSGIQVQIAPNPRSTNVAIETLQNPRSSVGAKLNALDLLDRTDLRSLIVADTNPEPIAVTLTDLARHSDKELAARSRAALDRAQVDQLAIAWLSSVNAAERKRGEAILFRLDVSEATKVLSTLPKTAYSSSLAASIKSGTRTAALRPTASAQGDRYYVQATWSLDQAGVPDCLAKLFNTELLNDRTLAQEQALMKGRTNRIVYWYDKEWAISMATKIQACGAKATFVSPGTSGRGE